MVSLRPYNSKRNLSTLFLFYSCRHCALLYSLELCKHSATICFPLISNRWQPQEIASQQLLTFWYNSDIFRNLKTEPIVAVSIPANFFGQTEMKQCHLPVSRLLYDAWWTAEQLLVELAKSVVTCQRLSQTAWPWDDPLQSFVVIPTIRWRFPAFTRYLRKLQDCWYVSVLSRSNRSVYLTMIRLAICWQSKTFDVPMIVETNLTGAQGCEW